MKTLILKDDINSAANIIKRGGLVGVPTETVYGLAANGLDAAAVEKIYEVKGRPAVKPLSLMVRGAEDIKRYCRDIPPAAYALADEFWPGPLTIVLKAKDAVPEIVRAGGDTVGLRCPASEKTLALIKAAGVPLAAPSANPSGEKSPVTAAEVMAYFDGRIDAVIDGGRCGLASESTIIDLSRTPYRVLRQGILAESEVDRALRESLVVIGITGGTGCGKTTALQSLEAMGALVIDCDEVYHELTRSCGPMLREIEARFPGVVEDGALDRKKLGGVVFSDPRALLDLNAMTHRYVDETVDGLLTDWAKNGGRYAAIDAIALIESGIAGKCAALVGVTAPRGHRVERLTLREGITREYAEKRIDAQKPNSYFWRNCDYTLDNSAGIEEFRKKCDDLFGRLLKEE